MMNDFILDNPITAPLSRPGDWDNVGESQEPGGRNPYDHEEVSPYPTPPFIFPGGKGEGVSIVLWDGA